MNIIDHPSKNGEFEKIETGCKSYTSQKNQFFFDNFNPDWESLVCFVFSKEWMIFTLDTGLNEKYF